MVKNPPAKAGGTERCEFDPWVRKIPWRRAWQPIPVFLTGNLMDKGAWWAPWSHKELHMTEVT